MKFFFPIFISLIYGCASSIPDGYVQSLAHMSEELEKTKAIANEAIDKVNRLEKMLSESISDRDSILYEHKKETALLRASDSFHKGNNALLTKNYGKAILYYKKTIEFRPSDAHAYNNLGNAYKEIENYSKAIDAYNNAIRLKPDSRSLEGSAGTGGRGTDPRRRLPECNGTGGPPSSSVVKRDGGGRKDLSKPGQQQLSPESVYFSLAGIR